VNAEILLPAVSAGVAGLLTAVCHRRLRPRAGAWLLAITLTAVVVAVVPAIVVLVVGYTTHLPWFGGVLAWCRDAFGVHEQVPTWLGVPGALMLGAGLLRLDRVRRSWRRFHCPNSSGLEVVTSADLFAYTLPGAGGQIVVSSALIDRLDESELAVVLTHERVHARHRHDRFVLLGAAAVAVVPPLSPLQRRLRFTLERWADETVAAELEVERRQVARTLASVALSAASVPAAAVGIVGLGVPGRVAALLEPPVTSRRLGWMGLAVAGVAAVLTAAAVQVHHVWPLLDSLCPG
jgi:Zn-dependent protease with chaperone function